MARSGTGALTRLLSEHRDIAVGLERYKYRTREDGWQYSPDLFTRERFFDFQPEDTNIRPDTSEVWQSYYEPLEAKWDDVLYRGDKMTNMGFRRVWPTMPQAHFVCIIRDIRAVAASWAARAANAGDVNWSENTDAQAAVRGWNNSMGRLERTLERRADQVTVVEHSRLFGDPDATALRALCERLGLEWTPGFAEAFERANEHYVSYVSTKTRELGAENEAFIAENANVERWHRVLAVTA